MIIGYFHQGSGLGNQLHRYVATRALATEKGYSFSMIASHHFKGEGFMELDMGVKLGGVKKSHYYEFAPRLGEVDVRSYDPEYNFIQDDTMIDGEFQDPRYFTHRLDEIRNWLKVEPLEMPDDVCVINYRGGEYKEFPDLYLTKEYWQEAIDMMKKINPDMVFEIHTDDAHAAIEMLGDMLSERPVRVVERDIGLNWRSIRYAKYLILSNSSFAILPALLNQNLKAKPIAPRYWARRNTGVWACPSNYYKEFNYI